MTALITVDPQVARTAASGLRFPEGPAVDRDGSLIVPEIEGAALVRVHSDGSTEIVAEVGGGANGCAFGPDGALYVCNDGGFSFAESDGLRFPVGAAENRIAAQVQRVDVTTGAVQTVFTACDGVPMGALNDIVFDIAGGAYVVDTLRNAIYYADPVIGTIRVAVSDLGGPNGAGRTACTSRRPSPGGCACGR